MSESPSLSVVAAHDVAAVPSEKGEREKRREREGKIGREGERKMTSTDKPSTPDMDC